MSVEQYLARHAEPEIELAARLGPRYEAALVVPVLGESESALGGYRDAARAGGGRVILIVIVNASTRTAPELRARNAVWLAALANEQRGRESLGDGAWVSAIDQQLDLLVIDRSSPGRELPPRRGVGLARKLGLDVALAAYVRGSLASSWLFSTDADVRLPSCYFAEARAAAPSAALLFPFRHVASGDAAVDRATAVYELMLRYHVLGLAFAGSPYAYHSVGSSLAVDATSYALVRGVPKREAGEDFYLLDKLAKVGAITRLGGAPIEIASRRSERVPFGTGPRVARIADAGDTSVAHPDAFRVLGAVLEAIDRSASGALFDESPFAAGNLALPSELVPVASGALAALDVAAAARHASRQVGGASLRRRLHTWFDALKTLRFLHALRAAGLSDLPVEQALWAAPFTPGSAGTDLAQSLRRLSELELELPSRRGPAIERSSEQM